MKTSIAAPKARTILESRFAAVLASVDDLVDDAIASAMLRRRFARGGDLPARRRRVPIDRIEADRR
jgi:hypothetical protein